MSKLTDGVSGFIVNIISYLNKGVVHYHKPIYVFSPSFSINSRILKKNNLDVL